MIDVVQRERTAGAGRVEGETLVELQGLAYGHSSLPVDVACYVSLRAAPLQGEDRVTVYP